MHAFRVRRPAHIFVCVCVCVLCMQGVEEEILGWDAQQSAAGNGVGGGGDEGRQLKRYFRDPVKR